MIFFSFEKIVSTLIEDTYDNTSFDLIENLDQIIDEADVFVSITSQIEMSFVLILSNFSVHFFVETFVVSSFDQESIILTTFTKQVTNVSHVSITFEEASVNSSHREEDSASSSCHHEEIVDRSFFEKESDAKVLNNIVLSKESFTHVTCVKLTCDTSMSFRSLSVR
jgi:hypothetical protein